MSKKNPTIYELRYTGDFGRSLFGVYDTYEAAKLARREAITCALANGNPRLAASFELC